MMGTIDRVRTTVNALAARLDWLGPLLARVAIGAVFIGTGWGKLHDLDGVTAFFRELGIPAPGAQAAMVSVVELVGGALLVVGLLTRYAAVPLAATMVVAILTAQRERIHGVLDLFGLIELAYLVVFVWLAVAGAGKASLDHLLTQKRAPIPRPLGANTKQPA
jgi:putative oxidoreductase